MKYTLQYIRSLVTINENDCWETGAEPPMVTFGGRRIKLARLSLSLINPNFDINNPKVYACHKCDNEKCVNPNHLFPGGSSANQKDHWDKVKGGKTNRSKFSGLSKPKWIPVDD